MLRTWKRRAGMIALLLWMAVVALAAWPAIARPGFLDSAHDLSVATLRLFGISAGQPLFQTDASPWKQHGYCLFVRERGTSGEPAVLFPPDGECRVMGFHPRLPPVDRATHRMLSSAWTLRNGDVESKRLSAGYLESIGRAFCRQTAQEDPPPREVEAVWIWYYRNYDDASVLRRNGLYFDYACAQEQLGEVAWHPNDKAVLARWGTAPW